ncbi:ABC transporter substrate-binding protein [Desulfobacterales bacterium HSG17]|nr:ABC transporter substrate-binding protein [Desulfobacterales bacterium HSG17]
MPDLKKLEKLLSQGKITRREFIGQTAALGLTAAISPMFFSTQAKAADVPKKGGTFKQALSGGATSDSLDPATLTASHPINVSSQLSNCLVEIDHNFQPVPELAESWDASPEAKTWTFKLQKGVEFHNGKTMTAEDVIFSINHHRGDKSKSAAKAFLKSVEDIKSDGKYTVVFTLSEGSADFPFIMGDYHLRIYPDGTQGKDWEKGIGTGGYIMKEWEPGVRALTKRNPNFWKENRAHFDEVETLSIMDVNARTNALKTKRLDAIERADVKTAHMLKKVPGINVTAVTGTMHYTAPMLVDKKPYTDNNVRMALKHAVNREEMVKTILKGYGTVGNDHPISSVNRYHAANLEQRTYDPDKAKFYMKKAGMLEHTFNLHASDAAFSGAVDAAVLYQESAKKAGIKINVVREPSDGYWKSVWTKKEWCMCYWSGRPVEDMMFSVAYATGADWNDTHWSHDKFNKVLKEARAELDTNKRKQLYFEMQSICRDNGGTVVPMFNQIVEAHSQKLGHGPISAHMEMDGHKNIERWWFN